MNISLPVARILGEVAEQNSLQIGVPMTIAIANGSGLILYYIHMDNALPASADIAITKAHTAADYRMTTKELGALAQPGQPLYGLAHSQQIPVGLFGGGIPLKAKNQVVGAVGVSGGTVDEDVLVAENTAHVFEKMLRWAQTLRGVMPAHGTPAGNVGQIVDLVFLALREMDVGLSKDDLFVLKGGIYLMFQRI